MASLKLLKAVEAEAENPGHMFGVFKIADAENNVAMLNHYREMRHFFFCIKAKMYIIQLLKKIRLYNKLKIKKYKM